MWHPIRKKIVISRDVTFMQKEKETGEISMNPTTRIEVEINLKNTPPKDNPPSDSEEEEVEIGEQFENMIVQPNLSQYSLARDRQRRLIVSPARYIETNYMNLVLNAIIVPNDQEPTTFEEAVSCSK